MTVILGINLSDRLYLAGDSRLSYEQEGKLYVRRDNLQKVENLRGCPDVSIACAGSARFACFIHDKMAKAPFRGVHIGVLRANIEEWLKPVADEYFSTVGYEDVTLILGGADSSTNKVINGKKFTELANAYTGGAGPILVNQYIQEVLPPGNQIEKGGKTLNISDTKLFSVSISQHGIHITDTSWGEMLIYGPQGLNKKDIGPKEIGSFEFNAEMRDNGSGVGNDIALINGFIYTMAEKYGLDSVGGSVVTLMNDHNGLTTFMAGEMYGVPISDLKNIGSGGLKVTALNSITVIGSDIYRKDSHGSLHKLQRVSDYRPDKIERMLMLL